MLRIFSSFRFASWVLALPVACLAQRFEVQPSTIPGIQVIGPAKPEFNASVLTVLPVATHRDALRPVLPYSFMVRYTGVRPITSMTIRYELTSSEREKPVVIQFSTPLIAKFDLITPSGPLATLSTPQGINYKRALGHIPQLTKVSVRAVVDAVVFEDGEFAGPNLSFMLEYYTTAWKRFKETYQELQALKAQPDAIFRAKLTAMAKEPPEWAAPLQPISFRSLLAKRLQDTLEKRGREALEKELASLLPPVPQVWKR